MIIKHFNLKKNINKNINFYLLYGNNTGLIEDTINDTLKPNFSKNIFYYEETEILSDLSRFKEEVYNTSFFENDKLIIINRGSDKLLGILQELIEKKTKDLVIIIKSGILEKKSKLRGFFEKNLETVIVPFYEDDQRTLSIIAQNFFKKREIKITQENINLIIRKSMGNRISLKNELDKILMYSFGKSKIGTEEILKLTNLAENHSLSELADNCLAKNSNKTINILNDNVSTYEDNILILKIFLYKLKRLKKIKLELNVNSNQDQVLSSIKPPIFWKDKDIIKRQVRNLSINDINQFIKKVNRIELLIKKNSQISTLIVNNFILENLNLPNNSI